MYKRKFVAFGSWEYNSNFERNLDQFSTSKWQLNTIKTYLHTGTSCGRDKKIGTLPRPRPRLGPQIGTRNVPRPVYWLFLKMSLRLNKHRYDHMLKMWRAETGTYWRTGSGSRTEKGSSFVAYHCLASSQTPVPNKVLWFSFNVHLGVFHFYAHALCYWTISIHYGHFIITVLLLEDQLD